MSHVARSLRLSNIVSGSSLAVLGLMLAVTASPVMAQTADDQPDITGAQDQGHSAQEVIITGSRIARSGFDQPTPVTTLGADQIQRQGATNVAEVLDSLPSFRPQSTPSTTAIFINNIGASTADLRGLGANRTLVLINGRRVVASTVQGSSYAPAGAVDLNMIPSSLIERVDVVTGGASAAYGSDAVAGVVNIILDTKLQGLKGSAQYGLSDAGDNKEYQLSLAGGTDFSDGRGHIVVGAEYSDNKGTGDCYSRSWCAQSYNTISNPFVRGSTTERVAPGQAATIIVPNTRVAVATLNGMIVAPFGPPPPGLIASGLVGTEFNPDGTTFRHDYGTFYGSGIFQSGGGDPQQAFYQFFPIASPVERLNIFSHTDYELSDKAKIFLEGSYGRVHGSTIGAQRRDLAAITVQRDNAYLPASVGAVMDAYNLSSVPMGRIWNDIGSQRGEVTRETYRIVAGAKFDMWADWTMDAYYQFGRTNYSQIGYNTTITPNMAFALDAVKAPGGEIVCRGVLQNNPLADGCQPLNPFGAGSPSAAAIDYVTGTATQTTKLTQNVASVTIQGTLFQGWAGPIKMATGTEFRQDIARGTADPISEALQFYTGPGAPISGKVGVVEGFAEVDVPIAKGASLNGAIRLTDYSTSGAATTWKIGGEWAPLHWLRFRGTRSRDIRAPSVFELYGPQQTSFQSVLDPKTGSQVLTSVILGGNPNLVPEKADTWTVGVVLQPDLGSAGRLRFSVDYYDIQLDGAVSTLGAQVIVDGCENGVTALCSEVTRDGGDAISLVRNYNLNLGSLITRGWDIEGLYTLPVGLWGGNISLRGLATIVDDLITDSASGRVNRAGMNGSPVSQPSGVPRYIINGSLSFNSDRVNAQVQVRHIAPGAYNTSLVGPGDDGYDPLLPNSISDNHIGAWTYVNVNASVALWHKPGSDGGQKVELFGAIHNLFNTDPPIDAPSSFGPTNNVLYDVIGRTYRMGVRFRF